MILAKLASQPVLRVAVAIGLSSSGLAIRDLIYSGFN
jgi:hypothetical protein